MKKFEEGVFSDLRNLKPGVDACLEEPKVGCSSVLFFFFCGFCGVGLWGAYLGESLLYCVRGMVTWGLESFAGCMGCTAIALLADILLLCGYSGASGVHGKRSSILLFDFIVTNSFSIC